MIQHDISFDAKDTEKNMDTLFSMLDEAIDDMENGRVFSEEEVWAKLAEVKVNRQMALKNYSLTFAKSALEDQIELKTYILEHFMYDEYGDNFDAKMKSAALYIKNTASSIRPTSFYYRKYVIYMLVHKSYLFFYVVDEEKATITVLRILNDGRDWMSIIKKWLRKNGTEKQNNCALRQLID